MRFYDVTMLLLLQLQAGAVGANN